MADDTFTRLAAQAEILRGLHRGPTPLLLANAWDVSSARAVAAAGFAAVATTSGGLDAALGFEDHNVAPVDQVFAAIARIAGSVDVPVTADIEGGFGLDADELVDHLLAAGAIGCNVEDSDYSSADSAALVAIDTHAARLAAIKEAGRARRVDIVLNARIDLWVRPVHHDATTRLEEAVERARAYRAAGADCVYPIVANDEATITTLGADGPINILARPDGPSIEALTSLGVRRISVGGLLYRAAGRDLARRLDDLRAGNLGTALG